MSTNVEMISGNLLGGSRAEVDKAMLDNAFVPTRDFRALITTREYNFVVGRRGTGKTALYTKVAEHLTKNKIGYVYCNSPQEYEQLELQTALHGITDQYGLINAITRIAWRACVLMEVLSKINIHYKFSSLSEYDYFKRYINDNQTIVGLKLINRVIRVIKVYNSKCDHPGELPSKIANEYDIEVLYDNINNALLAINKPVYFLFDGLDEGWQPSETSTAMLGGLANCAADILDKKSEIHLLLFVRDNAFRSLNYFDRDSSRHIEGNTIRLAWNEQALLHLVANRLRVSLKLHNIENDTKVWNRFAFADLKNIEGFKACLHYTLYRPRDIIVLLNTTFNYIARGGGERIGKEDIEHSSKQISSDRLNDLLKEYDIVFPGLTLLVNIFKGKPAFQNYSDVVGALELEIAENDFLQEEASDFALLGTGKEAFFALYSVGFIGLENTETQALLFCHDGSSAVIDASKGDQRTCVHPCYWKALSIQSEMIEENILIQLYDDNQTTGSNEINDLRAKRIGQIVSDLPGMEEGSEFASKFEEWVLKSVQMLFSGKLSNPELEPNKGAVQRRDVVATNVAKEGFWKRICEDYNSRQIVFEVKNYSVLKIDDMRQALSYSGIHYGSFVIIVNRNNSEGLSATEKGWIKEFWDQHKVLIFILPAPILSRCISKLRNSSRLDYSDDTLQKRLDLFVRQHLSLKHTNHKRSKKKRKRK